MEPAKSLVEYFNYQDRLKTLVSNIIQYCLIIPKYLNKQQMEADIYKELEDILLYGTYDLESICITFPTRDELEHDLTDRMRQIFFDMLIGIKEDEYSRYHDEVKEFKTHWRTGNSKTQIITEMAVDVFMDLFNKYKELKQAIDKNKLN